MPSQKDVTEIIGHIRATKKFKVAKNGAKHWKVLTLRGAVVTDDDGPLIISGSPSDERFKEMTIKRLIRAGVLDKDPFKETRGTKQERADKGDTAEGGARKSPFSRMNDDPEFKARVHEAKVKAIKAKSKKAQDETAVLRGRFEPIVPHLGGWSDHGSNTRRGPTDADEYLASRRSLTATELALVAYHWGSSRGRMELPKITIRGHKPITDVEMRSVFQTFKTKGGTLGDTWRPFVTVFVDELWQRAGTDPKKAAARYLELLREAKGIIPSPAHPPAGRGRLEAETGDTPAPAEPMPAADVEGVKLGPAHSVSVPSLALRSLFWFAKGGMEETEALQAAEQIARLEITNGGNT